MTTALYADLMRTLRHPQVRDLAWAILSPPLLEASATLRHPLSGSRWYSQPDLLADWLMHQDAAAEGLQRWLAQRSNRRLGLYYERLWQYALTHAPDIDLIVANLPIREGGNTLGELDLLIRDPEGVHHLELAVKFYLGNGGGGDGAPHHWIGPGGHDRLDLKLDHLLRHQLNLSMHEQAKAALAELTSSTIQPALWLGGYLFEPWPSGCLPPAGANPLHLRGIWVRQRDWPALAGEYRWQMLPRQEWLAPARLELDFDLDDTLRPKLDEHSPARLMARLQSNGNVWEEAQRVFVVPDRWPATDTAG
ncbi:DUF1853 family protein [Stutzerimonas azotifigens]|nr:DUF1853 family protein [Stutzerimonas azotifigens]